MSKLGCRVFVCKIVWGGKVITGYKPKKFEYEDSSMYMYDRQDYSKKNNSKQNQQTVN